MRKIISRRRCSRALQQVVPSAPRKPTQPGREQRASELEKGGDWYKGIEKGWHQRHKTRTRRGEFFLAFLTSFLSLASQDEGSKKPDIKVNVPEALKMFLVDDWESDEKQPGACIASRLLLSC